MLDRWLVALVVVLLVVLVAVVVVPREVRLYRRTRARGGLLELDSWEARNALALRDPEVWLEPPPPPVSALRRCNPGQRVHYHGAGDRCECGQTSNEYSRGGYALHPFADRGDAA